MKVIVRQEGRRYRLTGLTISQQDHAQDAGCRWDPWRREFWTPLRWIAEAVRDAAMRSRDRR